MNDDKSGILFLDLDGFKNVNDTLGRSAGDLAFQFTADRLREAVRSADLVSRTTEPVADVAIARLGGDEFTALILNIKHPQDAHAIAGRILQLCRRSNSRTPIWRKWCLMSLRKPAWHLSCWSSKLPGAR